VSKKSQQEIFAESEGDAYHKRNLGNLDRTDIDKFVKNDAIVLAIKEIGFVPKILLEVGCGDAVRLECVRRLFGTRCFGIEPSSEAISFAQALFPHVSVSQGVASSIAFEDSSFDAVFFGFCLYLCDRQDLFKIAYEADRVLANQGILVLMDFCVPGAYYNEYKHHAGIRAYKMDYATMFLWNPAYTRLYHKVFTHDPNVPADDSHPDEFVAVSIVQKNQDHAWPRNPY
jgi:ubiquinone/menaquinone biosynthesis C-methylase UbiE